MIKVAHESPLCIMDDIRKCTEYDYALVHLLCIDEYFQFFKESIKLNREIILDNSLYELGSAFKDEEYAENIAKLNPTYYIVPDAFNNYAENINLANQWLDKYSDINISKIGVVHGSTYEEYTDCYKFMTERTDKVAFTLGDDITQKLGRYNLIKKMADDNILDTEKPHHLLGCIVPQEFNRYAGLKYIDTIDTSSPVMATINNTMLTESGLESKPKGKIIDHLYIEYSDIDHELLNHNLKMFRKILC